jgi:hypothetical protein
MSTVLGDYCEQSPHIKICYFYKFIRVASQNSGRLKHSRLEPQRLIIIITLRLEQMLKSQIIIIIITLRLRDSKCYY